MKHPRLLIEWSIILCVAIGAVLALLGSQPAQRFDNLLYDRVIAWRAPPIDNRLLIVAIDEDSLQRLGRWPWPRALHAALIDRLRAAGARAIAYDVLFVEPSPVDEALGKAMRRGPPTFVPMLFEAPGLNGAPVDAVPPAAPIAGSAAGIGHVDLEADADGLIRHTLLAETEGGGRPVPHMMELAYRSMTGHVSPAFARGADKPLFIPFSQAVGAFPTISFAAVEAGEVPAAFLHGRTILVGATATGMGDRFPTPLRGGSEMPGIELQANILNGMLSDRLVYPISPRTLAIASVVPVILLMLGFWRWTPATALRWSIATLGLILMLSTAMLAFAGLWLPPSGAIAGPLLVYPLWGWRRLQAISLYVDQELARFAIEPDLAIPERSSRLPRDVIEAQTVRLADTIDRIRDVRRFASDTVHHLPDALFVCDTAYRITLANDAALRVAGGDPVGRRSEDVLSALSVDHTATAGDLVVRDGRRFVVGRTPFADADGVQRGWLIRLVDISAIRDAEQAREEILQLLSHDMRSPQASIITLVEEGGADAVPPEIAGRISRYARRTMALADNFVHLARIAEMPFAPEEVSLADLITEAVDDLWTQARLKKVRIETAGLDNPSDVMGEPDTLLRALINLIDNAVRFSPAGGTVRCEIVADAALPGFVTGRISDEGPGMAPDVLDSLFVRFALGSSKERRSAGLGLTFVKNVVDRHDGRILCDSVAGQGTQFTLVFQHAPISDQII